MRRLYACFTYENRITKWLILLLFVHAVWKTYLTEELRKYINGTCFPLKWFISKIVSIAQQHSCIPKFSHSNFKCLKWIRMCFFTNLLNSFSSKFQTLFVHRLQCILMFRFFSCHFVVYKCARLCNSNKMLINII